MSTKITVEQLMKSTGFDRSSCYGLLRFLEAAGIATRSAAPRDPSQRGRSVAVYDLPDTFALRLHALLVGRASEDLFAAEDDSQVTAVRSRDTLIDLDNVAAAS